MKKFLVFSLYVLFVAWVISIFYNVIVSGGYYKVGPWYHTGFAVVVLIVCIWGGSRIADWIIKFGSNSYYALLLVPLAFAGEGCNYAKSNQIVLFSEDCGVNWTQVEAGSRVPVKGANQCFIKETMPGFEMQGDMQYYVLFKDQVKVKIRLTYSYLIANPVLFMKSAKKLGTTNADADVAQDDNERFEGAENRVIETRIKMVTSDEFPKEDVVSHDMNALELVYVDLVNKELESRGVRITTFEMVPDFQLLTQQAIDAANADRIYTSKNMQEFGRQLTLARAGATQIVINGDED